MPINRDLSDLPREHRDPEAGGWLPDPVSRFGAPFAAAWHAEEAQRPSTRLARFRHSEAGKCARALAYAALGWPASNEIDEAGVFIASQGSMIHRAWQQVMQEVYPGLEIETEIVVGDRGGHADLAGWMDGKVIVVEAKTTGGYAYKQALGVPPAAYVAQGPKYEHVLQGAINGHDVGADEVVILYLTREAISKSIAERHGIDDVRRVVAEWTLTPDEFMPLAIKEIERVNGILRLLDEGELPKRRVPDPDLPQRHLIVRPQDGSFVELDADGITIDTGRYWGCDYCRYQDLCSGHPADRTPIKEINHEDPH